MPQRHLLAMSLMLVTSFAWAAGQAVSFLGLTSEVPAEWVSSQPSSTMRVLQFDIPGGEGGDGAQFVVYFFGPGQGGSLEANLERWVSQFSSPDGKPVEPVVTPLKSTMSATLVELRGSYARNVGMGPSRRYPARPNAAGCPGGDAGGQPLSPAPRPGGAGRRPTPSLHRIHRGNACIGPLIAVPGTSARRFAGSVVSGASRKDRAPPRPTRAQAARVGPQIDRSPEPALPRNARPRSARTGAQKPG